MVRNDITFTTEFTKPDAGRVNRMEDSATLFRPQKLTHRGAERILRKRLNDSSVIVIRVEASAVSR
jgi:hypothetical protein